MKKLTTCKQVATVIFLILSVSACGQKGDLYLPEGSALISWIG